MATVLLFLAYLGIILLIGLIVNMPFSIEFFMKSILLFSLYLFIRFFSIVFSLRGMNFDLKEKIFMSLNAKKGIAVAVVVFSLGNLGIEGMSTILNLILTFMLYSIILSAFILRASKFFIKTETKKSVIYDFSDADQSIFIFELHQPYSLGAPAYDRNLGD